MRVHASWSIITFDFGVIIGDIFACIFEPTLFSSFIWLVLSLIILVVAIIMSNIPALILAFLAGIIIVMNRAAPSFISKDYYRNLIGKTVTISGEIIKDPEDNGEGKKNLTIRSTKEYKGQIFTQVSNIDIKRSDKITISGELSEGFSNFDAVIFRPEIQNVDRPEPGDIFLKIRDFFAGGIKDYLPDKQASLGLGYLLGQKSGVDKSFQESLRTVGLTHIIVASGAHLGVLVGIARKIFGKFSRFSSLLSGLIFMFLFIGITGLSASMLRAGLVTGLSLIAWYYGRNVQPARIIFLVAAITLIINPAYLTDLAWLLSFASFFGILIVAPILIKFFYNQTKKPGFIASTFISSISAALLCTPILLYFFGSVSLISVIANILILPTISIAMGLTFLTGLFAIFIPILANFIGQLDLLLLNYQISVVEFFGDKKMFLIEIPAENPLVFLLYIPVIVVIITTLIKQINKIKKHRKLQNSIKPMLA